MNVLSSWNQKGRPFGSRALLSRVANYWGQSSYTPDTWHVCWQKYLSLTTRKHTNNSTISQTPQKLSHWNLCMCWIPNILVTGLLTGHNACYHIRLTTLHTLKLYALHCFPLKWNTLHTALKFHSTVCSVHYSLCRVHLAKFHSNYSLRSVHYAVCSVHYAVCSVHHAVCSVHYAVCSVPYAVCSITLKGSVSAVDCAVCTIQGFSVQRPLCRFWCALSTMESLVCSVRNAEFGV